MKNYFTTHNTYHTPRFFLLLENVIIQNYNKCSKLTLTQKIEEPLSISRGVMKNYFSTHDTHHTPRFFLWLKNVVIPNYNKYSKLTLTQKIEEPLSTLMSACSEAIVRDNPFNYLWKTSLWARAWARAQRLFYFLGKG